MSPADNTSYFVRFRGRVSGPFTLERLRGMAYAGQLGPIHEVSTDRAAWGPASTVAGLLPDAPGAAPAPAPAPAPKAADPPPDRWYYLDARGVRVGPLSAQDLLDLADDGSITGATEVWSKAVADWVPFAES